MIPIIGDVIREVGETVRELIPDADKRMEIEVRLAEIASQADERETQLLLGQIDVNKADAQSGNMFQAGWRPFIGWTCGAALAYTWIAAPVMKVGFRLVELPIIDPSQIYPIVLAMLGVAGMRTFEKTVGVAAGATVSPTVTAPPKQMSKESSPLKKLRKFFT
jgi:hypothetical protein